MNKSVKRIACLLLSMFTAFSVVACGGGEDSSSTANSSSGAGNSSQSTESSTGSSSSDSKDYKYDTETRPVVFATEALDGNFNPFFATSATDSEMAAMTQIGMLTTDREGNVTCGEDEPTVALAWQKTEGPDQAYTDYEFIIKNSIKFSDGVDLTIKDVLFNLYVYLDPSYMGSATIYSTDIVGLKKYRAQDPHLADDSGFSDSELNARFYADAIQRRQDILDYLDKEEDEGFTADQINQINKDIGLIKEMFREEVENDWTMHQGTLEGYEDEYTFTEDWQVYYLVENIVRVVTNNANPSGIKDKDGKYVTNITPYGVTLKDGSIYGDLDGNGSVDEEEALKGAYNETIVDEITKAMNDEAKLKAYTDKGATQEDAKAFVARDFAIDTVYKAYATESGIDDIVNLWATGANILDKFMAEARTAYFDDKKKDDGSLVVETVEGITTTTTTEDFEGNDLGESHDVLKIRINGIDPKAEYNFGFSVAPMHYYSGIFEGVDYVQQADGKTKFGVAFNNNRFFEDILQADEKNAKPVGAGVYQVSNEKGETTDIEGSEFYSNNWVYFARNNYFETVGDGLCNAKIKYLHYRVVNSDKLIQALQAKDIDVGEPNATATNITEIGKIAHLNQKTVTTNGYGYVGINPKYVPDIEVRRAIMSAMDPIHCLNYYTKDYAEIINRSMSSQSWIWKYVERGNPQDDDFYYYPQATTKEEIINMVKPAGWEINPSSGMLEKDGKQLKLTFTIAGATDDHPAYTMFMMAQEFLNGSVSKGGCGFDISVTTDVSALKKLATGDLQVWAAAWSSTADPDMYQVYHKDSKATSVKNWGYPTILNDSTDQFLEEQGLIEDLSVLIEDARKTNDQEARAYIYEEALEIVMQLAVEMPTYQRKDCVAYNKDVIDAASLNQDPTAFEGVIDKIWELDYN